MCIRDRNSSGEDFAYGSGFFVAPDLVATNLHVIEGAAKVRIRPIGSETESDVTGFTAVDYDNDLVLLKTCLLYTSPSPRDRTRSRMPSSA